MDRRDAAVLAYERGEGVDTLAVRHEVTPATIRAWLREAGIPLRARPSYGLRRVVSEPYNPEPTTEKARRVWKAWRATPGAKLRVLAQQAGVSEAYASRLIGHWKAQEAA